ncbi:patatin-like phospholipase family protein [Paraburkholderia oxyphila]|uniref:patatin-like phospholipase family protein n=1 Tax=Paraburkholderia oxyphila TaxID=614212 RepID=UPI00048736DD|nr:patatin-like phospholipase family protein [Paraburkholderia oxyphila]
MNAYRRLQQWAGLAGIVIALVSGCGTPELTPGLTQYEATSDTVHAHALAASDPLVGVGLSGGGNRSAIFASYVLDLFGSLPVDAPSGTGVSSFLGTIGYLSSVSGGSFANAYFGVGYPVAAPQDFDVLVKSPPNETDRQTAQQINAFFTAWHVMMNHDWRRDALVGGEGSAFSASNAQRLSSAIDAAFLHDITFADLNELESRQHHPYLIFNTTHYDTGHRFVMTTIPRSSFCVDTEKLIRDVLAPEGEHMRASELASLTSCDASDPLTPEGFDWIAIAGGVKTVESGTIHLAQAVALSGAFPVVVGPVAYRVSGEKGYLHFIDGGITDNSGIESIMQLFLHKLIVAPDRPQRRALIVEIDASKPFNADGDTIADSRRPLTTLAADPGRLPDIQEVRANLYRRDLWSLAQRRATPEKNKKVAAPPTNDLLSRVTIVSMSHTDLDADSLSINVTTPDPVARGGTCQKTWTHADLLKDVRNLPTDYVLDDACQVELLRVAACWSVSQHAAQIQQQFAGAGRPVPSRASLDARIATLCPELKQLPR